jgi:phosphatidylserine decarboxylase
MKIIHKKGIPVILLSILLLVLLNLGFLFLTSILLLQSIIAVFSLVFLLMIIRFFRRPIKRIFVNNEEVVVSPADGVVAAVEEVDENIYLKDKRIQISVFMSIYNIHINWYPISGEVCQTKYQPGKYLVARNPKSSLENEMFICVIKGKNERKLLYRQIAGAVARRIISYPKEGDIVQQGSESGIIMFGSRLDILLPLDAEIKVKIGDKLKGGKSVLAKISL